MQKVPRPDSLQSFVTGNQVYDEGIRHFMAHFPRLMAPVRSIRLASETRTLAPQVPSATAFAVIDIRDDLGSKFEVIEELAFALVMLSRYLRFHSRHRSDA